MQRFLCFLSLPAGSLHPIVQLRRTHAQFLAASLLRPQRVLRVLQHLAALGYILLLFFQRCAVFFCALTQRFPGTPANGRRAFQLLTAAVKALLVALRIFQFGLLSRLRGAALGQLSSELLQRLSLVGQLLSRAGNVLLGRDRSLFRLACARLHGFQFVANLADTLLQLLAFQGSVALRLLRLHGALFGELDAFLLAQHGNILLMHCFARSHGMALRFG